VFLTIEDGRTGIVTTRCPLVEPDESEAVQNVSSWNAINGVPTGRRAHLYRDDGAEIEVPDALIPMRDPAADLRVGRRG